MELTCFGLLVVMFCQAENQKIPVDTFCNLYHPVFLSHADTRETKTATDRHNRIWKAICRQK